MKSHATPRDSLKSLSTRGRGDLNRLTGAKIIEMGVRVRQLFLLTISMLWASVSLAAGAWWYWPARPCIRSGSSNSRARRSIIRRRCRSSDRAISDGCRRTCTFAVRCLIRVICRPAGAAMMSVDLEPDLRFISRSAPSAVCRDSHSVGTVAQINVLAASVVPHSSPSLGVAPETIESATP